VRTLRASPPKKHFMEPHKAGRHSGAGRNKSLPVTSCIPTCAGVRSPSTLYVMLGAASIRSTKRGRRSSARRAWIGW